MFPTDPTETLASIGGMVSCDASGACSYKYGSIRKHVVGVTLVTPTNKISIKRGQYKYSDLREILHLDNCELPKWQSQNSNIKDVAGLYYDEDMDLIDLIIGSEGIFGVITEVDLLLIEEPKIKSGVMLFLNKNNKLVEFVELIRSNQFKHHKGIAAIEYFDHNSLKLLNRFRDSNPSIKILPVLREEYYGSLYLEFHVESNDQLDELLMLVLDEIREYGINEENERFFL